MAEDARAFRALRYRSALCGGGVLLLWVLARLTGWLEGQLLSGFSGVGGALFSLALYCLMMGIPLLFLLFLLELPRRTLLPLRRSEISSSLFLPLMLGALVLLNLLGWEITAGLGRYFEVPAYSPAFGSTPVEIAVGLLASTLFPAVLEELFFRGALLHGLQGGGAFRSVAISALLFMVCHSSVVQWIPALGAGFLFGWLAYSTGSLRGGIVSHFCYNLFASLAALFPGAVTRVWLPAVFVITGVIAFFLLLARSGFCKHSERDAPIPGGKAVWTAPLLLALLLAGTATLMHLKPL